MKKKGRPKKWTSIRVYREVILLRRFVGSSTLPTLKEFSGQRGYSSQRWSEWSDNREFSESLKKEVSETTSMCKEKFETMLIKGGLAGKLDKTVVIFALKNVAGWRDERSPAIVNTQNNLVSTVKTHEENAREPEKERAIEYMRILHRNKVINLHEVIKDA